MNRAVYTILITLAAGFLSCTDTDSRDMKALQEGFQNPPAEAKAKTLWYWTGPYITREGITADLEAMKAIGYHTAMLYTPDNFNPAPPGFPEAPVMSDAWRELFRYAAGEARRLGMDLGVINCPGWSSSGGPWIQPEDAAQQLVATAKSVSGTDRRPVVLEQPDTRHGFYRDVAVLAFPSPPPMPAPRFSAVSGMNAAEAPALVDGDPSTSAEFPTREEGGQGSVVFSFDKPYAARFAAVTLPEGRVCVSIKIEISDDGRQFREAGQLLCTALYDCGTPKLIELKPRPAQARHYRFIFSYLKFPPWMTPYNTRVKEIRLLSTPMIDGLDMKNSSGSHFAYAPAQAGDADVQGIDPDALLDLSDRLKPDGTLDWDVPPGNWTVLRIGYTPTGAMNAPTLVRGLECDKLSRRGMDAHWPHMVGKLVADTRDAGTLKYASIDSYEAGGQNWTDGLEQEFERRRGYSMRRWLPAVLGYAVATPEESARFLYDFEHTVSDLFAENYFDYFAELCHKNGLLAFTESYAESYGGPFDNLRTARNADMPAGEYWLGDSGYRGGLRMASSIAHFHGKAIAGAEAFTTEAGPGRWLQDPFELKINGDKMWLQGISSLMMHVYVHQPFLHVKPGLTLGRHGTHLTRNVTWWNYGSAWVDYINRSQFLLQQGQAVADLLILSGESNPNRLDDFKLPGYQFDYCGIDDLLENVTVKNGRITAPSGMSYAVFSLGPDRYLSLATLQKVEQLLQEGATVAGLPPFSSPSLSGGKAAESQHRELVEKLWGENPAENTVRHIGKGQLIISNRALAILQTAGVAPDFRGAPEIGFVHRRLNSIDIYMLNNSSDSEVSGEVDFRVSRKTPTLWRPDPGTVEALTGWKENADQSTALPVVLAPYETCFIIFAPGDRTPATVPTVGAKNLPAPVELNTDWQLTFPEGSRFDRIDKLTSWTAFPENDVRYFSGTANYEKHFVLPDGFLNPDHRVTLDLGEVKNLAEVEINGKRVAVLWKPPFTYDVTEWLQPGDNRLTVRVTNLWVNRMIGDEQQEWKDEMVGDYPKWVLEDRPRSESGRTTWSSWKGWTKDDEPLPSGLLGPVCLRATEIRNYIYTVKPVK